MDAEVKRKWVEALRSGKFTQGSIHLRNGHAYCCLGVLCVVALDMPLPPHGTRDTNDAAYRVLRETLTSQELGRCEYLNDCEHRTFSEIADEIEVTL